MTERSHKHRYRLYLINPRFKYKHYAAQQEISTLIGKKRMTLPLQLPLIAALTPDNYEVRLVDDEIEDLTRLPVPDLVGITTIAATAGRVFEISDHYRSLRVPVVLGGSYASFRTDECLAHADHVVVGEAEGSWHRFLADFEAGHAQPVYRCDTPVSFKTSPLPRWDLVVWKNMMSLGVETSRGCAFKCDFCVVNKLFGNKMRFRDVDDVVKEIESLPIKRIFFVADNFALKKSYARQLVERLKPLGISWICQTSIEIADDDALLHEMAEAGCLSILIGFESLNERCLQSIRKHHNHVESFEEAIKRIHAHGINVLGSFIVGFDGDTPESFDYIYDFMRHNALVYSMLNVLSVAPGTELFERMQEEGRIQVVDPSYRNGIFPCIRYANFTQVEMLDRFFETLEKAYSWEQILDRAIRLYEQGTFVNGGNAGVPLIEKIRVSLILVRRYLLSRIGHKRRLFIRLFQLVRQQRLSMNDMVVFLLSMEGYHQYVVNSRRYLPEVRRAIAAIDTLPYKTATVSPDRLGSRRETASGVQPPLV